MTIIAGNALNIHGMCESEITGKRSWIYPKVEVVILFLNQNWGL